MAPYLLDTGFLGSTRLPHVRIQGYLPTLAVLALVFVIPHDSSTRMERDKVGADGMLLVPTLPRRGTSSQHPSSAHHDATDRRYVPVDVLWRMARIAMHKVLPAELAPTPPPPLPLPEVIHAGACNFTTVEQLREFYGPRQRWYGDFDAQQSRQLCARMSKQGKSPRPSRRPRPTRLTAARAGGGGRGPCLKGGRGHRCRRARPPLLQPARRQQPTPLPHSNFGRYHSLLPTELLTEECTLPLEDRARIAVAARRAARLYARERGLLPVSLACALYDGLRGLVNEGAWQPQGLSDEQIFDKYAQQHGYTDGCCDYECLEDVYYTILVKSCKSNSAVDALMGMSSSAPPVP